MKSDRIKNWPKEERPRERLLAEGADKLTEAELLLAGGTVTSVPISTVPMLISFRVLSGLGWQFITFPVLIGAFFLGQFAGGRLQRFLAGL